MSWRFITCAALFVTCLLTANTIAAKLIVVGGVVLTAGIVISPLSYVLGDVLTEVWGYAAARRVIWLGFGCNVLMVIARRSSPTTSCSVRRRGSSSRRSWRISSGSSPTRSCSPS